jgi:hypothetical protein
MLLMSQISVSEGNHITLIVLSCLKWNYDSYWIFMPRNQAEKTSVFSHQKISSVNDGP